jgi:hypothetical protein
MPAGRLFRLGMLALLVPVGVLSGHGLTYLLAIPDPTHRAELLAATGHHWWASAVLVGAVLAVGGVLWFVARHLRHEPGSDPWGRDTASWLAPRLASCQLVLFAGVEVAERMVTGHSLGELIDHEIIERGLISQVVVALVLTGIVWCLTLTVELACVAIDRPWLQPVPRPVRVARPGQMRPRRILRRPPTARAPPVAC